MTRRTFDELMADLAIEDITPEMIPQTAISSWATDQITPQDAGHVLFVAQDEVSPGIQPGEFTRYLIKALFRADPSNFVKLALAYPGLAWAVKNYTSVPWGPEFLRKRFAQWGKD